MMTTHSIISHTAETTQPKWIKYLVFPQQADWSHSMQRADWNFKHYFFLLLTALLTLSVKLAIADPISNFVVLYFGSQGSSWFAETLSNMKDVCVIGNELIDRVKGWENRTNFMNTAVHVPDHNIADFEEWRNRLFSLASEPPSDLDKHSFGKCTGHELSFGYKARLSLEEIQFIASPPQLNDFNTKIVVLNRNPVTQALSAYRRDVDHHDQRRINGMISHMAVKCDPATGVPEDCDRLKKILQLFQQRKAVVDGQKFKSELIKHLKYYDEQKNDLSSLGNSTVEVLHVSYEEMEASMDSLMLQKVRPFLNLSTDTMDIYEQKKVEADFFKMKASQSRLCDAIENYNDFCENIRKMFSGDAEFAENEFDAKELSRPGGPDNMTIIEYANVDACSDSNAEGKLTIAT